MSDFRRFQAPIVSLLLVLLASPALVACCVWTADAMPCCEKAGGAALAAPCCMSQVPDRQQQPPASPAKMSRSDAGQAVAPAAQPSIVAASTIVAVDVERTSGPPGSDPLYIRLSVIRR